MTSGIYKRLVNCCVFRIVTSTKFHKELVDQQVSQRLRKWENHCGHVQARVWEEVVF